MNNKCISHWTTAFPEVANATGWAAPVWVGLQLISFTQQSRSIPLQSSRLENHAQCFRCNLLLLSLCRFTFGRTHSISVLIVRLLMPSCECCECQGLQPQPHTLKQHFYFQTVVPRTRCSKQHLSTHPPPTPTDHRVKENHFHLL